ncbi:hypothetical protein [Enterocloster lavalensis]|uniref:hypothetical protein n=1 Tax=Enterocloster lavalensis TaxID=460384 RepID=UPI002665923F|nr:hypothetical protein [Enterocloster lavalensis]
MKIMYDETEVTTMKTLLRQIQVIGDQQAAILAMLGQTVRNGKVIEEKPKQTPPKRQRKVKQLTEEQKPEKEEK